MVLCVIMSVLQMIFGDVCQSCFMRTCKFADEDVNWGGIEMDFNANSSS